MRIYLFLILLLTVSCNQAKVESITIQRWRVDTIWKKPIVGIDDEINPNSYLARLSNGDTVPVASNCRTGDTIEYRFIKLKRADK